MGNDNFKIAVCWYKENQWERFKEIVSDKENIEDTYLEWRKEAEIKLNELKSQGLNIKKILVDTEEMLLWANEQGRDLNGDLRSQYAAHILKSRDDKT